MNIKTTSKSNTGNFFKKHSPKDLIAKFKKLNKKQKIICCVVIYFSIVAIAGIIYTITSSIGGSFGQDSLKNACSKAIEDGDYSTFYREACVAKGQYSKDDFIKACENSGKKFWSNPSSSADECMSEEEYNKRTGEDERKARSECSKKGYGWNTEHKRCNSDEEEAAKKADEEERKAKAEVEKKTQEQKPTSSSSQSSTSNTGDIWTNPQAHYGETVTLTGIIRVDFAWYDSLSGYKKATGTIPSSSTNYGFWLKTSSGTAYVTGGKAFSSSAMLSDGDTLTITGKITSDDSSGNELVVDIPK